MKVRNRNFEQYNEYQFNIPFDTRVHLYVKEGEEISFGDDLFVRMESAVKESIYLPKVLGCNIEDSKKYVIVLAGEFVDKGDILAEKISSNGLTVKRISSFHSGVVSVKRINDGYIDILGEQSEVVVKSSFSGRVIYADPVKGLRIEAETTALDLMAVSRDFFNSRKNGESITGEFVLLGDGTSIYRISDLEDDYKGKIVFAGKYVYEDVLKKLFELGAVCVLVYSIDYNVFRSINLPVGVIGGFGNMYFPSEIRKALADLSRSFVVADGEEKQLFFVKKGSVPLHVSENQDDDITDVYIGERVMSYDPQSYGRVGTVVGYDKETEYLTVEFQKGLNSVVALGAVDFVSL
jgi:hypothetical protein